MLLLLRGGVVEERKANAKLFVLGVLEGLSFTYMTVLVLSCVAGYRYTRHSLFSPDGVSLAVAPTPDSSLFRRCCEQSSPARAYLSEDQRR